MQRITTTLCLVTLLVNTTGLPVPRRAEAGTLPCGCDLQARERGTCCCGDGGSSCCAVKKPSCCSGSAEETDSEAAPQAPSSVPFDWVVAMAARDCLGLDSLWLQLANAAPPPPVITWRYEWILRGTVVSLAPIFQSTFHAPETPPPRTD